MKAKISNYGFYKVTAASPELRIANPEFNADIICKIIKKNKSDLFVFPELSITGYSCQDLFFQKILQDAVHKSIEKIRLESEKSSKFLIVGAPLVSDSRLFNTAVVINNGNILGVVPKTYLCNYTEYYEERWFASEFDRTSDTINVAGINVPFGADLIFVNENDENFCLGIEICEDMWSPIPPAANLALSGATVIANLSASNEYLGKSKYRLDNIRMHSGRYFAAYIYAASGLWESTSDTVFSGKSIICENSSILAEAKAFSFDSELCTAEIDVERLANERLINKTFSKSKSSVLFKKIVFDLKSGNYSKITREYHTKPFVPFDEESRNSVCSEITEIQTSALARRLKHTHSKTVVLGISGGLDSTLALLACYHAFEKINLDKKGIIAVTMPGFGTTKRTKNNATIISEALGITLKEISIAKSVELHFKEINHDINDHSIVFENAQARKRTHLLMDIANQTNGIVIGTADLSETALGWCTFSGDQIAMYNLNVGIPKTLIQYLIEWYSTHVFEGKISKILKDIINTPISPELLPPDESGKIAQKTEEKIGPYILHDFFIYYMLRHSFKPEKILFLAESAFKDEFKPSYIKEILNLFCKRFMSSQFKRNVAPDSVKVGTINLSPRADWRMPSEADLNEWILK